MPDLTIMRRNADGTVTVLEVVPAASVAERFPESNRPWGTGSYKRADPLPPRPEPPIPGVGP